MTFSRPADFALAAFIALLLSLAAAIGLRRRAAAAIAYSNLAFMAETLGASSRWLGRSLIASGIIALTALAVASGGPHLFARVPAKDAAVVICIDTSGSMRSSDVEPTRWDAAKAAAHTFIDKMPTGTQIGIVAFSGGASLVQPLTADRDQARAGVERIPEPNGSTAIGDALAIAGQVLPVLGHRIIVLLTDGVNNRGADPQAVAQELKARGITVYTVGVGTHGSGQFIPGTTQEADLDEGALNAIAQATGGRYARATNAAELQSAFSNLAGNTIWERRKIDASLPFAIAGGALLGLTMLAGVTLGRFP